MEKLDEVFLLKHTDEILVQDMLVTMPNHIYVIYFLFTLLVI